MSTLSNQYEAEAKKKAEKPKTESKKTTTKTTK